MSISDDQMILNEITISLTKVVLNYKNFIVIGDVNIDIITISVEAGK